MAYMRTSQQTEVGFIPLDKSYTYNGLLDSSPIFI